MCGPVVPPPLTCMNNLCVPQEDGLHLHTRLSTLDPHHQSMVVVVALGVVRTKQQRSRRRGYVPPVTLHLNSTSTLCALLE